MLMVGQRRNKNNSNQKGQRRDRNRQYMYVEEGGGANNPSQKTNNNNVTGIDQTMNDFPYTTHHMLEDSNKSDLDMSYHDLIANPTTQNPANFLEN